MLGAQISVRYQLWCVQRGEFSKQLVADCVFDQVTVFFDRVEFGAVRRQCNDRHRQQSVTVFVEHPQPQGSRSLTGGGELVGQAGPKRFGCGHVFLGVGLARHFQGPADSSQDREDAAQIQFRLQQNRRLRADGLRPPRRQNLALS